MYNVFLKYVVCISSMIRLHVRRSIQNELVFLATTFMFVLCLEDITFSLLNFLSSFMKSPYFIHKVRDLGSWL